jgi:hypothetical protein
MCYGGGFGTMPASVADYFASKNVGPIYRLMLTAWVALNAFGALLIAHLRQTSAKLSKRVPRYRCHHGSLHPLAAHRPSVREGDAANQADHSVLSLKYGACGHRFNPAPTPRLPVLVPSGIGMRWLFSLAVCLRCPRPIWPSPCYKLKQHFQDGSGPAVI